MNADEIISALPTVASAMDEKWLRRNPAFCETVNPLRLACYHQLEDDLSTLRKIIPLRTLISEYRSNLRDRISVQKAMFEVHGAAFLASAARSIQLHVPRGDGSNRNYDILADIEGTPINAECKTRKDQFGYNVGSFTDEPEEVKNLLAARSTMDPHDADELGLTPNAPAGDERIIVTPESTTIRQTISQAQSQLPESGINLVLFGQIEGRREDLEGALVGAEVFVINGNCEELVRKATGAFGAGPEGERFRSLSAVLWYSLEYSARRPHHYKAEKLLREYELYLNPAATCPLPPDVIVRLETAIAQRMTA